MTTYPSWPATVRTRPGIDYRCVAWEDGVDKQALITGLDEVQRGEREKGVSGEEEEYADERDHGGW